MSDFDTAFQSALGGVVGGPAAPDAFDEALRQSISGVQPSTQPPAKKKPVDAGPSLAFDPMRDMTATERFRAGIGKGMTDMAQGVGQALGLVSREDVAAKRKLDAALESTTGGKVGQFVGNVALTAPLAALPGANTLLGAAGYGAAFGALAPSASTTETVANTALGGVAGAAVPAAIRAGQVGLGFVEPLYQGGRDRIVGRAMADATGGNAADVLRRLQAAGSPIPGLAPTAAEVAQNPGIAALQRTATAVDPVAMNAVAARQEANNLARRGALEAARPDVQAATAAREQATNALYAQAQQAKVTLDQGLETLLQRPSMQAAMARAQQLAKEAGESLNLVKAIPAQASTILNAAGQPMGTVAGQAGSMSGKAAHYIKMALDDMANASPATGIAGNELRAIQGTRADFLKALEAQVPAYGQARQTYAQLSKPITQAQVIDEVLQRSAPNIADRITPAAFNRAARDQTVRGVTGQANATLANTMSLTQLKLIEDLKLSLKALEFANSAGRGVGSDTVQKLAFNNLLRQSGVPQAIANLPVAGVAGNVMQRVGNLAYRDANEKMASQLANALIDPKAAAGLLELGMVSPAMKRLASGANRAGLSTGTALVPMGLLATDLEQ